MSPERGAALKCTSTRHNLVHVYEHCPQRPYVELKLPQDVQCVTAVSFITVSRDQGWADNKATSFSGFEARLRRPGGICDLGPVKIHSNRVANDEPFRAATRLDIANEPPHSRRRAWLQALQPNDVIQLIPKAMFPGWVNIVLEASIEIEYQPRATQKPAPEPVAAIPYQPLTQEDQQIRVLVVKPGAFDDIIHAHFESVSLDRFDDDQEGFHALSYCWGDSLDTVDNVLEIESIVGSGPFRIGRTIERAIRRLRVQDRPLRIWIDALCIDQGNHEERVRQVSIMGSIYSRAKAVHIWLGDENPGFEAALRVFHDIYNYNHGDCRGGDQCRCPGPTKHIACVEDLASVMQQREWVSTASMYEIFNYHHSRYFDSHAIRLSSGDGEPHFAHLIHAFFLIPWFHRVWVIQEALLARQTFVHYRAEVIDWRELLALNDAIKANDGLLSEPTLDIKMAMPAVWKTLASSSNREAEPLSILEVFLAALDLKATNPRDKLFGLLALGRETRVADRIPLALRPNYEQSLTNVMADFTRWWIIEHNSLDILSFIHCQPTRAWRRTLGDSDERADMRIPHPTWALATGGHSDWSRMTLIEQFSSVFQAAGHKTREIPPEERYLLHPGPDPHDRLGLVLRGRTITKVVAIAHPPIEIVYPYAGTDAASAAAQGSGGMFRAVFNHIFDPCGHTGAWSRPGNSKREGSSIDQTQWLEIFHHHLVAHAAYIPGPPSHALRPRAGRHSKPYKRCHPDVGLPSCIEACFFIASNGLYGLCPWRARKGDVVAVLHGGKVPYLLRRAAAPHEPKQARRLRYELVGECFIDGLMNGEGVETAVGEAETFILL
ncbi:putative heterokaryon incompatibility protein [Rosellinia necatrix]|uniref:Putative heterokaryon incompatibility protein n=1 Tax=Rosellinia necatrix TaxID=77044 RepID=A0A1S7UMB5_ROSNE|nr:putative heterokaryon incompatibility protein [Rosellinia necatrix]